MISIGRGRRTAGEGYRDRRGEVLFIDARKSGELIDRVHRELTDEEIDRIEKTYHAWRGDGGTRSVASAYKDIPGFCRSVGTEEIGKHGFVLTPGRYVGVEEVEEEEGVFEEKMAELTALLGKQFAESARLEKLVRKNLEWIGYAVK